MNGRVRSSLVTWSIPALSVLLSSDWLAACGGKVSYGFASGGSSGVAGSSNLAGASGAPSAGAAGYGAYGGYAGDPITIGTSGFGAYAGDGAGASGGYGAYGGSSMNGGYGGYAGSIGVGGTAGASLVLLSPAADPAILTTRSVNYWMWAPTYGDYISGTESSIAALTPTLLRIGGYNNDANTPDVFDNAAIDKAVAYASTIGARIVLQVPLISAGKGKPATAAGAAAMVKYANISKGYKIPYFSIGNEPDLYSTQGAPSDSSQPAFPGYTADMYCASARSYVSAMKAVDPTIRIVGPDLSWQYQPYGDFLTPVLKSCGDLFDVIAIHRYPFEAMQATTDAAAADAATFTQLISSVRSLLANAGYPMKPLAISEMNIVYDATSVPLGASPGTVAAALWLADMLGVAFQSKLWTNAVWNISDTNDYSFGLLGPPPSHTPRPAYYAYALYGQHFGSNLLTTQSSPPGVHIYGSRSAANDTTLVIAVNWNSAPASLQIAVSSAMQLMQPVFTLPALSMAALEIPDLGPAKGWLYGDKQLQAGSGPSSLAPN